MGLISVILKMCSAKFCVFFTVHFFIWIIRMDPKRLFVPVGAVQGLARFLPVGCFCIYETRLSHLSTFTSTMLVEIPGTYV